MHAFKTRAWVVWIKSLWGKGHKVKGICRAFWHKRFQTRMRPDCVGNSSACPCGCPVTGELHPDQRGLYSRQKARNSFLKCTPAPCNVSIWQLAAMDHAKTASLMGTLLSSGNAWGSLITN